MGPSGSRALFIALDTKGHLRMKVKIPSNGELGKQQGQGRMVTFLPQALQAQGCDITVNVTDLFSPSALQRLQHSISKC